MASSHEEQQTLLPRHVGDEQSSRSNESRLSYSNKKSLLIASVASLAIIGTIGISSTSDFKKTAHSLLRRAGLPKVAHFLVDYEPPSTVVYSKGSYGYEDLGKEATDEMFVGVGSIWKRECDDCSDSHKLVYYKRLTAVSNHFSVYDNMKNTWSSEDNILNRDFELYSSYEDLVDGKSSPLVEFIVLALVTIPSNFL